MCLPVIVTYFMEDYLSPFTDKILIYGIGYGISVALISVIAESGKWKFFVSMSELLVYCSPGSSCVIDGILSFCQ